MQEIEVKILEIDKDHVIATLEKLGAQKVFDGQMNSSLLDTPAKDMAKKYQLLRIRQKGPKCFITFKDTQIIDGIRTSDELEVDISDFERMREIFKRIGFQEFASDLKHRTSYKFRNSLVEIDEHADIPSLMEVESPNNEELREIVELLGFTMDDTTTLNWEQVLEKYKK